MRFFSGTVYRRGLKFLQVIYESFDCDLTQGFLFMISINFDCDLTQGFFYSRFQ